MEAHAPVSLEASGPFKLLFFIDKRPNSTEQVRSIRDRLQKLQGKLFRGNYTAVALLA